MMPPTAEFFQPKSTISPINRFEEPQQGKQTSTLHHRKFPVPPKRIELHLQTAINLDGTLSRLIVAAAINHRVRNVLLTNPGAVVALSYQGEKFKLSPSELAVLPVRATSLCEFAQLLLEAVTEHNSKIYDCCHVEI